MGTKISEKIKKHVISWDEDRGDLLLKEYQESTLNPNTNEYDIILVSTKKVGGADYANMYDDSSSSVTTITLSNTWYKLSATTICSYSKGFTHITNGKLIKVGDAYGPIKIQGVISLSDGNNNEIDVAFYKNGIIITNSLEAVVTSSGGKSSSIAFQTITELVNGDYIEVYVNNTTGTSNITLKCLNVILTELT